MMVVRMSPVCGWNMAPRIIKPNRNIESTLTSSSVPRPVRFSRKCPPPGISHPSSTAGAHLLTGGVGLDAALAGVVGIPSSLARESVKNRLPYGRGSAFPDHSWYFLLDMSRGSEMLHLDYYLPLVFNLA